MHAEHQDQQRRHQGAPSHAGLPDQQSNEKARQRIQRINRTEHASIVPRGSLPVCLGLSHNCVGFGQIVPVAEPEASVVLKGEAPREAKLGGGRFGRVVPCRKGNNRAAYR